jgi:hypothetical protein
MNTSIAIRTWLEANGPHPSRHVADALGIARKTCGQLLATMVNEGTVTADDEYPRRYTFVRHAVPAAERIKRANTARLGAERADPEARRERARAADKAYYRRNRERLLANKRAREQRKREATAAERAQRAEERRAAREAALAAQRADCALQAKRKALERAAANAMRRTLRPAPKIEHIRTETYDEFLARGGQIERLPMHAVSAANQLKGRYA